jgi:hypothetical protein
MTAVTPSSPASAAAGPQTATPAGDGAAAKPQAAGAVAEGPPQPATAADAALMSAAAFVRAAAARQGGLAALYADLESIVTQPSAAVPAPVLAAARQLLAMRLDVEPGAAVTADDIKAALAQSGLFGDVAAPEASPQQGGAANLGNALATLRQALQEWLTAATDQAPSPNAPAPATAASPAPPRGAVPMPPYRGAPTVAQAPVAASIPAGASPRVLALHLIGETDAAIARQSLLQMASLPDAGEGGGANAATHAARLMFDLPLATLGGTAVAQLLIEPDRQNQGRQGAVRPVWRARFSVDLEPIGPVHVRIALAGERTSVTMTAERSASTAALSASLPLLEAGLREAALKPGELRSQTGAAPPQAAAPGLFVDHAT